MKIRDTNIMVNPGSDSTSLESMNTSELIMAVLGFLCLLAGFVGLIYVAYEHYQYENLTPAQKLHRLWKRDVTLLEKSGSLPKEWERVRDIQLYAGTEKAKLWLSQFRPPITVNKDGDHRLEILLIAWVDGDTNGAIVQYNLVNLNTQNMIWELGRTYVLEGDPKVTQLVETSKNSKDIVGPTNKNPTEAEQPQ